MKHKHLLVRATITETLTSDDCKYMQWRLKELIKNINMEVMFGPFAVYCDDPGNEGMTGFAIIKTSHIAFHHWSKENLLELDVYSCKEFELETVFCWIREVFKPEKMEYKFLDREETLEVVAEGKESG